MVLGFCFFFLFFHEIVVIKNKGAKEMLSYNIRHSVSARTKTQKQKSMLESGANKVQKIFNMVYRGKEVLTEHTS